MQIVKLALITPLIFALCACDASKKPEAKQAPIPLISVSKVQTQSIEVTEDAIGSVEGLIDPNITSEIAAKVVQVYVSVGEHVKKGQLIATLDGDDFAMQRNEALAEVARIQAQLDNQAKTVARNQALVNKKFISQNAVDNDVAQQNVLKEQLAGAKARVSTINHGNSKTKIFASTDGRIEKRIANAGEYVHAGDPIVQIISNQKLRAHIPFPEHIASKIRAGQTIKLTTPTSNETVVTTIKEIKPLIMTDSRAIDVIADIINQSGWQAGASVNAQVVLNQKDNVLVVPEQSIVLRPAGEVVYVIKNNLATQRIVQTGERKSGLVEVISGLESGLEVAVDGASYLTDNTKVKITNAGK
ncbi:MAG TPA: efflux RND transporter periplasmic adaptor subunit [Methylotenera sp.]|nr:efflux RND transporter periplasmic adaptor subunit [Methylotenera sp.]HPH04547.1 efflux RND transporter periplasmic adaptor subunit [Methylotenera sp.]HPN00779.1 efflux RND transporter periplasmic adaptor subunit [Methylotenera sp.]